MSTQTMARRADTSLAAILLTQRLVDAASAPFRARDYWTLLEQIDDPGRLLGRSVEDLSQELGDADLAARLVGRFDAATLLALEVEKLERLGIRVIASVDEDYPRRFLDRLGAAAPPLLHVVGPIGLLDGPTLGVVGSRDVAPEGAEIAEDAARRAVEHGWTVISGGARGVDRLAMDAALEAGGRCAGLLADSLVKVTREPDVRVAVGEERLCLATPYAPSAGFSAGNAMGRNKLIYSASDTTLVVAADHETGGTWGGATEALSKRYGDVAVWMGPGGGPGNEPLVARGARPIEELDQLWDVPTPPAPPEPPTSQLHLGV